MKIGDCIFMSKSRTILGQKYYTKGLLCVLLSLCGCAEQGQGQMASQQAPNSAFEYAPNLAKYTKFDIISQIESSGVSTNIEGAVVFYERGTFFDVTISNGPSLGKLFFEPDACKNDPNPYCQRNFVIAGLISTNGGKFKCFISTRKDKMVSSISQPLVGRCQDDSARISTIHLYSM
jgi:hypothetical protein